MKKILKEKLKQSKGITLIALVITIIVLLILAGVSIAMLTGDNGLLGKANEAKIKTDEANEFEQIKIATLGSIGNDGKVDDITLIKELNKLKDKNIISNIISTSFPVKVSGAKTNIEYSITEDGEITKSITATPPEEVAEYTDVYVAYYYDDDYGDGVLMFSKNPLSDDEVEGMKKIKDYGNVRDTLYCQNPEFEGLGFDYPSPCIGEIYIKDDDKPEWCYDVLEFNAINKIIFKDEIVPKYTAGWFATGFLCSDVIIENETKFNTSRVVNMDYMFYMLSLNEGMYNFIKNLDTSNVTSMEGMFFDAVTMKNQPIDLTNWKTGKLENATYMFGSNRRKWWLGDSS